MKINFALTDQIPVELFFINVYYQEYTHMGVCRAKWRNTHLQNIVLMSLFLSVLLITHVIHKNTSYGRHSHCEGSSHIVR